MKSEKLKPISRISITILSLVLSLVLSVASGCQGDSRPARIKNKAVTINLGSDPRSLDPSLATDIPSSRALMCFTRGLTMQGDDGIPRPELAENWTSTPDGMTWDFKIRPAKWSNGDPVTANDFAYTWTQRMLNRKFAAEYAYQLFYIKGAREFLENPARGAASVGVEAVAPDHLHVRLACPAPFFPSLLAHNAYYPVCEKVDRTNPDWAKRAETYVGCGPFVMETYRSGDKIVGRKNPNYWNAAAVKMERLTLTTIEDEMTERVALDSGQIDATYNAPRADIPALRGSPELVFSPQYSNYYLALNCKQPALKDVRVRRALALAIDRAAIIKNVSLGGERPAFFFTPPELYRRPPAPMFKDAQFDEARRLLAQAGHPMGAGLPPLRYIYNTMDLHQKIAQVLQETWRKELGINLQIQNQEFKVHIDMRRQGNFDVSRDAWQADFPDPINFLELFDSKSDNNDSHFEDPHYDALLAAARAEPDPEKREEKLKQTEAYLIDQMPLIPVFFQTLPYLKTPELEGYLIDPLGMFDAVEMRWK